MIPLAPILWTAAGWLTSNAIGLNDLLTNAVDPKIRTPNTAGNGSNLADYIMTEYMFRFMILAPSNDDLKAIDDFFESYGYRVDLFKVPKLNVRSTFTFVKTKDAVVYSDVKQASDQLATMLNAGTKFWVGEIGK